MNNGFPARSTLRTVSDSNSRFFKTALPRTPDHPATASAFTDSRHFNTSSNQDQNGAKISPDSADQHKMTDDPDPTIHLVKTAPSLYELMPFNPKYWVLPPKQREIPLDQLEFPHNEIAKGNFPQVPEIIKIEEFSHFAISLNEHIYKIVYYLDELLEVLVDIPKAKWFPCSNYSQANWFMLEGFKLIDGFDLEDLKWYAETYDLEIKVTSPPSSSKTHTTPQASNATDEHQDSNPSQGPNNIPAMDSNPTPTGKYPTYTSGQQFSPHQGFMNFTPPPFPQYPYNMFPPHHFPNMSPISPPWLQMTPPGYTNVFFKEKEINIPRVEW